jgi:NAD(P)-dependent dehydrogenase (short-subunit alcohol dehydrogenase family)
MRAGFGFFALVLRSGFIWKEANEMDRFPQFSLDSKVAIILGGGRGMGRAMALTFADAGADVAISSRTLSELEEVADGVKAKGRRSLPVVADAGKPEDLRNFVTKVISEFGRIDILVNNAGFNFPTYSLMDVEEQVWDSLMNVNLKGPFILSQLAGRRMREQGSGCIINITSLAGLVPWSKIYSVTKAGLIMLTEIMAKDWGQYNIRVNAIAPGLVKTKFAEPLWKEPSWAKIMEKNRALTGRIGVPEDAASAALFLASDASSYITGITIVLDGGERVGPPIALGDM